MPTRWEPLSPEEPAGWLERCKAALHRLEDGVLGLLLLTMILLASAQILLRNLFDASFAWGDPLLRMLVLWVGLLGALAASRDGRQISIDLLPRLLDGRAGHFVRVLTHGFTAGICAILAFHAGRFVQFDREAGMVGVAGLPVWWFETILPVAFGLICLRYALGTVGHIQALVRDGDPAR